MKRSMGCQSSGLESQVKLSTGPDDEAGAFSAEFFMVT
jgi:hypothetical protein